MVGSYSVVIEDILLEILREDRLETKYGIKGNLDWSWVVGGTKITVYSV